MRRSTALPIAAVLALYAAVSPVPWTAAGLLALLVVPLLVPLRAEASRLVETLLSAFVVVVGTVVLTSVYPNARATIAVLRSSWAAFAGAVLLLAVVRFYLKRPIGGDVATLALNLVALTACGGAVTGWLYPLAVVVVIGLTVVARRLADAGTAPIARMPRGTQVVIAAVVAIAGGLTWLTSASLPPMHEWAMQRIWLQSTPLSGFSDRLWLGSLRGMLLSDEKVLRIRSGEDVDYLRGIAYNSYDAGRWSPGGEPFEIFNTPTTPPRGDDVVAIELLDDDPRRYFFPLGAAAVTIDSGTARFDSYGIIAPLAAETATRMWYRPGEPDRPVSPPGQAELAIDAQVRPYLRQLLRRWAIREQGDPRRQLEALQHELETRYTYSLEHERGRHHDPTVDFLYGDEQGHCEYFASSFALLARELGLPTRVIGGYRVMERNPLTGHMIVRERNAHAWVEVWLDGAWTTWDPTPASELVDHAQLTTPWLSAFGDLLGAGWASFLAWLDQRSWTEMIALALAVFLLPIGLRLWRRRRGVERAVGDGPLPCYLTLEAALAQLGVVRAPSETLEQLAQRLERAEDRAAEGAPLVLRYAALRYGDLGDEASLRRDIERWTQSLDGSLSAGSGTAG